MAEAIEGPRPELYRYAPSIGQIQIPTEKIGMIIGKGGETIRALSEEFEAQIDIDDDGTIRVFAVERHQGDALIDRIRSMTKEVEVGDEFTGKVVKTTTFGAFIELAKGTDGLLHISNVKPGERVDAVEDVLNRGDEIEVRVVEVDRERGRVGLRLADDPDIAGKTSEELAGVGTGDKGGSAAAAVTVAAVTRRPRGRRGGRRQRRRPRPGAPLSDEAQVNALPSGVAGSHRARRLGALDRARVLGQDRSRDESARPGGALALPRAPAVQGHGPLQLVRDRRDLRRHGRRGERGHRQGDDLGLLPVPRPPPRAARSTCCRTWSCGRATRTSTPSARW